MSEIADMIEGELDEELLTLAIERMKNVDESQSISQEGLLKMNGITVEELKTIVVEIER